jgi:hypothetical protein
MRMLRSRHAPTLKHPSFDGCAIRAISAVIELFNG